MQDWLIAVIVVSAVAVIFLFLLAVAAVTDKIAFGKRSDKNPSFTYFTAEYFSLDAQPVEMKQGKNTLRGYIYSAEKSDKRKLIIFCHGMGPGQVAYTTEIAYFCNLGYKVLAFDGTGCNMSDGKGLRGMYEGVRTAVAAIDFARRDDRFKDMPVCLIGHSWGAYSVLCASAERKADRVIAISGFNSPSGIVQIQASSVIPKFLAAILRPFWWLINAFKFGARGNAKAAECADKSGAPTLIIHGDGDAVVPLKYSAYAKAKGENVRKLLVKGRAHNPYVTAKADALTAELLKTALKVSKTAEDKKFMESFDFVAATEEDAEIMQAMADFLSDGK